MHCEATGMALFSSIPLIFRGAYQVLIAGDAADDSAGQFYGSFGVFTGLFYMKDLSGT